MVAWKTKAQSVIPTAPNCAHDVPPIRFAERCKRTVADAVRDQDIELSACCFVQGTTPYLSPTPQSPVSTPRTESFAFPKGVG